MEEVDNTHEALAGSKTDKSIMVVQWFGVESFESLGGTVNVVCFQPELEPFSKVCMKRHHQTFYVRRFKKTNF